MVKMCIDANEHVCMPLLDKLITYVIKYSIDVHPLIDILLDSGVVTFDYISKYAAKAWEYKNDTLGVYFLDMLEKGISSISSVVEYMCKEDMIIAFRRSEKHWCKMPLRCLNEALKYESIKIINYLSAVNTKVRLYLSDNDRKRHIRDLQKYGLYYIVDHLKSGL
jgi:hypothetical protein